MSSADLQAKIKRGLAKAVAKTGSSSSELVYRVRKTQTGTPLAPATTETTTLLVNAIFKSYDRKLTDINIRAGDRELVSDSDVEILQNDVIRQGSTDFVVIAVDYRAPTSDPLVNFSQVRKM
jgi:hypothetical protein